MVSRSHEPYLAARWLRVHPLRQCGAATVAWAGRGPLHRAVPFLSNSKAAAQHLNVHRLELPE